MRGGVVWLEVSDLLLWRRAEVSGIQRVLAEVVAETVRRPPPGVTVRLLALDAAGGPRPLTADEVMPRVAALLDVMQISDILKVEGPDTFERTIYAGSAIQTVRSKDKKKVVTVRTAAFPATGEGGNAPIEEAKVAKVPAISSFVGEEVSKSERFEPRIGMDDYVRGNCIG